MKQSLPKASEPEIGLTMDTARQIGLRVRNEAISALTSAAISNALRSLSAGISGLAVENVLSPATANAVLRDLEGDTGWSEELWLLNGTEVQPVSNLDFESAQPNARFSKNECLRKPAPHAWSLRGFLSAIVSNEVRESFSRAFGENVEFRSVDIARYRTGDYLRRHADNFEARRFGFVFFLSSGWLNGAGGELVIESPTGEAIVVYPLQGSIAILSFRQNCFHQVARISKSEWVRYSIAFHFSLRDGRQSE